MAAWGGGARENGANEKGTAWGRVCVCVCVREREREAGNNTAREGEGQGV